MLEGNNEDVAVHHPSPQPDGSSPQRPSKRRKVVKEAKEDVAPPVEMTRSLDGVNADLRMEEDTPLPSSKQRSPTPPPLPIFPLPVLPNAPSKSTLALQGLDKALIDAEVVDPDVVLPIPSDGPDDGGTRLSEKMRKRLHDSGITELFASTSFIFNHLDLSLNCVIVQTTLLPFLIPSSNIQRQLYISTQPARDVCVSAPTGSGKTLAYVIPIIEVSCVRLYRSTSLIVTSQILSSRVVTRLRALVVLPTRDLVTQVREVFEVLGKGRGLKVWATRGSTLLRKVM